jgi:hypothetical protein
MAASANRYFEFHTRSQLFISARNKMLCVAMCISNPDFSPCGMHG